MCTRWIRGIVTRGFSGDLMETSVEVFLMVSLGITAFLILLALLLENLKTYSQSHYTKLKSLTQ